MIIDFKDLSKFKKLTIISFLLVLFILTTYLIHSYQIFYNTKEFSLELMNEILISTKELKEERIQKYKNYSEKNYQDIPNNCPEGNHSERIACITTSAEGFMHNRIYKNFSIHTVDDLALLASSTKYRIQELNNFYTCESRGDLYGNLFNFILGVYETAEGVADTAVYITILENRVHKSYYINKDYYLNKTEKEVLEEINNQTNIILNNMSEYYNTLCKDIIENYPKARKREYISFEYKDMKNMVKGLKISNNLIGLPDCMRESISKSRELNEDFAEKRYNDLKISCKNKNYEKAVSDMIFLLGYLENKNIDYKSILAERYEKN